MERVVYGLFWGKKVSVVSSLSEAKKGYKLHPDIQIYTLPLSEWNRGAWDAPTFRVVGDFFPIPTSWKRPSKHKKAR